MGVGIGGGSGSGKGEGGGTGGSYLAGIAGVFKSFVFLTLSLGTGVGDRFDAAWPAES